MYPVPVTLSILPQPDDVTCGPTSLHAVYAFHGRELPLQEVIDSVHMTTGGGTLAVHLGIDALRRGFRATLYSYNLSVFDPSWDGLAGAELAHRLRGQREAKREPRIRESTDAYLNFLAEGGTIRFDDPSPELFHDWLDRGVPLLAGLSATYLYRTAREMHATPTRLVLDDIRGHPVGHFVVVHGIDGGDALVADPYRDNPLSEDHHYRVGLTRLIHAVLLGVVTYDGNILAIGPDREDA